MCGRWYTTDLRFAAGILCGVVAGCGASSEDRAAVDSGTDGGADVGASGSGGAAGGASGASGASGAGGAAGLADASISDAESEAALDSGTAGAGGLDGGSEAGPDGPCVGMCKLAVVLNCSGGPNNLAECPVFCAALAAKGAGCKQASDVAYQCMVDVGAAALACGAKGAHAKCGYCDAQVVQLETACGFTTGCVP